MPKERLFSPSKKPETLLDPLGGSYVTKSELKLSEVVWQKETVDTQLSDKNGLLSGVSIALGSIKKRSFVSEQDREYMRYNALTQALEATTHGLVHVTHQRWDPLTKELKGFGRSTMDMLQKGIEQIEQKNKDSELDFDFERQRRNIELQTATQLNKDVESGMLDDKIAITISPYPDNAEELAASNLGYFTEQKGAMIRIHDYDKTTGTMITKQIMLESSDTALLSILMASLSPEEAEEKSADELLEHAIYISKNEEIDIIDIAYLYDNLLEQQREEEHFFGRKESSDEKKYEEVNTRTTRTLQEIDPILENLTDTEREMARSLYDGAATENIKNLIKNILDKQRNGTDILPQDQIRDLDGALNGQFTEETAEIITRQQLIEAYKLIMVVTDPKRATQSIDDSAVYSARKKYFEDPVDYLSSPPTLKLQQDVQLNFCGGTILANGQGPSSSLYNASIGQINNAIKNLNSVETGKRIFCCKCPECKKQVEAEIYGGKIHCPECGATEHWSN